METKICTKCGKEKPLDQYYNSSRSPDGKISRCIPCDKIISANSYQKKIDDYRDRKAQWQEENRDLHNYHVRQYADRKKAELNKIIDIFVQKHSIGALMVILDSKFTSDEFTDRTKASIRKRIGNLSLILSRKIVKVIEEYDKQKRRT